MSIPVNRAPGDSQPLDRPTDGTIIGAIIVVVGIIIAVLWRFRTSWLPHFLYWLYTKLRRDEVLDNFARGEIYAYLRLNPGDTYAQIKRNLHLAAGPLTYHLAVLEREGLIRSVMQGPRKHFYPADARIPEGGGDLHYIQARALHVLCEEPGMTVSDLAENLGVSRHVALYHLRKLVGADRVRLERKMARLRAYPVHRGAEARASAGR